MRNTLHERKNMERTLKRFLRHEEKACWSKTGIKSELPHTPVGWNKS